MCFEGLEYNLVRSTLTLISKIEGCAGDRVALERAVSGALDRVYSAGRKSVGANANQKAYDKGFSDGRAAARRAVDVACGLKGA